MCLRQVVLVRSSIIPDCKRVLRWSVLCSGVQEFMGKTNNSLPGMWMISWQTSVQVSQRNCAFCLFRKAERRAVQPDLSTLAGRLILASPHTYTHFLRHQRLFISPNWIISRLLIPAETSQHVSPRSVSDMNTHTQMLKNKMKAPSGNTFRCCTVTCSPCQHGTHTTGGADSD